MRRAISSLVYVASFICGRSALFVAPLVLSNLLSTADYGRLEWALAAGTLISTWSLLGTASALPLVMLVGEPRATLRGIYTHHLLAEAAPVSE